MHAAIPPIPNKIGRVPSVPRTNGGGGGTWERFLGVNLMSFFCENRVFSFLALAKIYFWRICFKYEERTSASRVWFWFRGGGGCRKNLHLLFVKLTFRPKLKVKNYQNVFIYSKAWSSKQWQSYGCFFNNFGKHDTHEQFWRSFLIEEQR